MSLKNNKHFRRFAAALMAGTMMVSMFGMTAFAEGNTEGPNYPTDVTITKQVTKEEKHYAPNTTFQFTIEPGTAVAASEDNDAIYAGPEGGAYFAEGVNSIAFSPKAEDIGKSSVEGVTQISLNNDIFKKEGPGIYRYVVKEVSGSYEGITYSKDEKNFDVYVISDGEVFAYTFTDTASDDGKDDGIFINDYTKDNEDTTGPHDLTIIKKVTGNQGNKGQDFKFTITVNGTEGEAYYIVCGNDAHMLMSGDSYEINLKNGEDAIVYGLTESDKVTVTEDDYSTDGYETSYQIGPKESVDSNEAKDVSIAEDTNIIFTNHRQVTTPTGVILNIAPYIVMVALAGVLAFVFLRRRNNNF